MAAREVRVDDALFLTQQACQPDSVAKMNGVYVARPLTMAEVADHVPALDDVTEIVRERLRTVARDAAISDYIDRLSKEPVVLCMNGMSSDRRPTVDADAVRAAADGLRVLPGQPYDVPAHFASRAGEFGLEPITASFCMGITRIDRSGKPAVCGSCNAGLRVCHMHGTVAVGCVFTCCDVKVVEPVESCYKQRDAEYLPDRFLGDRNDLDDAPMQLRYCATRTSRALEAPLIAKVDDTRPFLFVGREERGVFRLVTFGEYKADIYRVSDTESLQTGDNLRFCTCKPCWKGEPDKCKKRFGPPCQLVKGQAILRANIPHSSIKSWTVTLPRTRWEVVRDTTKLPEARVRVWCACPNALRIDADDATVAAAAVTAGKPAITATPVSVGRCQALIDARLPLSEKCYRFWCPSCAPELDSGRCPPCAAMDTAITVPAAQERPQLSAVAGNAVEPGHGAGAGGATGADTFAGPQTIHSAGADRATTGRLAGYGAGADNGFSEQFAGQGAGADASGAGEVAGHGAGADTTSAGQHAGHGAGANEKFAEQHAGHGAGADTTSAGQHAGHGAGAKEKFAEQHAGHGAGADTTSAGQRAGHGASTDNEFAEQLAGHGPGADAGERAGNGAGADKSIDGQLPGHGAGAGTSSGPSVDAAADSDDDTTDVDEFVDTENEDILHVIISESKRDGSTVASSRSNGFAQPTVQQSVSESAVGDRSAQPSTEPTSLVLMQKATAREAPSSAGAVAPQGNERSRRERTLSDLEKSMTERFQASMRSRDESLTSFLKDLSSRVQELSRRVEELSGRDEARNSREEVRTGHDEAVVKQIAELRRREEERRKRDELLDELRRRDEERRSRDTTVAAQLLELRRRHEECCIRDRAVAAQIAKLGRRQEQLHRRNAQLDEQRRRDEAARRSRDEEMSQRMTRISTRYGRVSDSVKLLLDAEQRRRRRELLDSDDDADESGAEPPSKRSR